MAIRCTYSGRINGFKITFVIPVKTAQRTQLVIRRRTLTHSVIPFVAMSMNACRTDGVHHVRKTQRMLQEIGLTVLTRVAMLTAA